MDNVTLDPGTGGAVIAADDIGGVQYPRGKLALGADGAATDAVGGAGVVGADTQRVTLGSNDPAVASLASLDSKTTAVNTGAVVVSSSALPTGAATSALQTQPGVDIGDVTVNNGAGAAAVNIQDGGNAITVDGSVSASVTGSVTANAGTNLNTSALALEAGGNLAGAATSLAVLDDTVGTVAAAIPTKGLAAVGTDGTNARILKTDTSGELQVDVLTLPALVAGTANIGDVDVLTVPAPLSTTGGGTEATALRVTVASDSTGVLSVDDNGGALTVDGTVTVVGGAAHASPVSGNPNLVAGRASNAIPTDVGADGDVASMWTNRNGAQMVSSAPHIGLNGDPWSLASKTAQYTSAQTSTVLQAGGASEKIVVTKLQIQVYGTTAGTAIVYFGTGAYSRGTSRAIFDGEFAPSATLKPGVVDTGPWIAGANGDDVLVTTTNALSITITVWYYLIT